MTLTQTEYEEMEDQLLVDPETGEVLSADPTETDLPKLARAIKSRQRKIDKFEEFRRQQIEQINASVDRAVEREQTTIEILHQKARLIVSAMDDQKAVMPGIGRFRFRKLPESVDDSAYREMGDEARESLHKASPELFTVKTTISPDKKAIKELLKGGVVPGFSLLKKDDVFEFKPE